MRRKSVEYFESLILSFDVQNPINSRPFTYRCSEDAGFHIITPNAFLHPHFNTGLFLRDPEKIHELTPSSREALLGRFVFMDLYLREFHDL